MPAKIIDGKEIAASLNAKTAEKVIKFREKFGKVPGLAVLLVGNDPASEIYVSKKEQAAKKAGINFTKVRMEDNAQEGKVREKIEELNKDNNVHGIIVQLPLPEHLNGNAITQLIDHKKDVDGFHFLNLGKIMISETYLAPATAKGIHKLLDSTGTDVKGANVVVVGQSLIVGRPTAQMFMEKEATVTTCNKFTKDLSAHTKEADVLISSTGVAHLIKKEMVKPGSIVIDVGITKHEGKIVGDVDFENVKEVAGWITPVPGGVGPMTVACLLENVLEAAEHIEESK